MENKLMEFLNSPIKRTWLVTKEISVYLRKGRHVGMNGAIRTYLDIANIEVRPAFQRKGIFKSFLSLCQRIQPYDGVFVENVLTPILRAYLRRLALEDGRWFERGWDFLWEK